MEWTDRIGYRLRLRDLHILLAVAQWRGMARAARELAISQPAVSKAIADLEHTLGVRLLERSRHGIEPTIYGRALIKRGYAIFDDLQQTVAELQFLADPTAGELRVGAAEAMTAGLLPAVIDQLLRQYPRITLQVAQTVFATTQYRELRERTIDLLLGRIFMPLAEDDIDADVLFDDPVVIVAASQSPWARSRRLALADLANAVWVLPPAESPLGVLVAEVFRAAEIDPRCPVRTLSIHVGLKLVSTGRFVTALPASVVHFGARDLPLKVLPINLPVQPPPVGILTLKSRTLPPVAKLFIESARKVVRPLANARSRRRPSSEHV
jgi:DNA-binding transcriptional LysR family regulator